MAELTLVIRDCDGGPFSGAPSYLLLDALLEGEGLEGESFPVVKLGLELDPVEAETVEEGGEAFHDAQDADRQERPEGEDGEHDEGAVPEANQLHGDRNVDIVSSVLVSGAWICTFWCC